MPLPRNSRLKPITARVGHCARVGAGTPRQRSSAYSTPPAITKRVPEITDSGGMPPSSARWMPR